MMRRVHAWLLQQFWLRFHLQTMLAAQGFDPHGRPGIAAFDFLTVNVVHWRNHPGWYEH